jgi:prophage antirepressor-like protein
LFSSWVLFLGLLKVVVVCLSLTGFQTLSGMNNKKQTTDMGNIKLFQNQKVRTYWNEAEQQWYFSVVDVIMALTDSVNPTDYLKKIRKRDDELNNYLGTNCPQVEMLTPTGKKRKTLASSTQHLFRIIQSIPSPKAEPLKQWLAKVGYERVQEIEDPELAQERMKYLYEQKGYPKDWIDKRLRGIAIRQNLTDEWKERGITVRKSHNRNISKRKARYFPEKQTSGA